MLTDETLSNNEEWPEEQATLLDTLDMPRCVHHEEISCLTDTFGDEEGKHATRIVKLLDLYLEQPFLLDSYLGDWVVKLVGYLQTLISNPQSQLVTNICKVLYTLCKIRGAKAITVYFEHSVDDVVPLLRFAHDCIRTDLGADGWMVNYIAILMASIAILIPFDLERFHRRLTDCPDLFKLLNAQVKAKLKCSGRERQAAVVYMSALFKRKDFAPDFAQFISEAKESISLDANSSIGMLECVAKVLVSMQPSDIKKIEQEMHELMSVLDEKCNSCLLRKCRIKLYKRLAGIFDINQCLDQLLSAIGDSDTIVRLAAAKGISEICKLTTESSKSSLIGTVLNSLVCSMESAFPDPNHCHGAAFLLAEALIKKLVPVESLQSLISLICKLLRFEVPRGRFALGSAVRDSACYMVWAMARSYSRGQLRIEELSGQLVCTALFDREVSCRRAAAASFQELTGRWDGVPSGINLFTIVNFFNISQRRVAFESLALQVATTAPEYKQYIVDHLVCCSINSWDKEIRQLGAALLCQVTNDNGSVIEELVARACNLDDLGAQHGAILSLSHIAKRSAVPLEKMVPISIALTGSIPPKMLGWELIAAATCLLISSLAANPLCVNRPIEQWLASCSLALQSRDDTLHSLVATITLPAIVASMPEDSEIISTYFRGTVLPAADKDRNINAQRGFMLAIGAMPKWLFISRFGPLSKLLVKVISSTSLIEKRVNAICSLGSLYRSHMGHMSHRGHRGHRGLYAETSTEKIFNGETPAERTLTEGIPDGEIHRSSVIAVMSALEDYTIDSRGDIGSIVRLAAMRELPSIFCHLFAEFAPQFTGKLLFHMVDKLDKLRLEAVKTLETNSNLSLPWDRLKESNYNPREFFELLRDYDCILCADAEPALDLLVYWLHHAIQSKQFPPIAEECFGIPRLRRAVLHVLDRLLDRGVSVSISLGMVEAICVLANDCRTQMHDLLTASGLLCKLAPQYETARLWINETAMSHEYAAVRDVCQSITKRQ
ncbi:Tubulin-specific chaperone D [Paramicrosporidium saccamoebae]|uniref:Tubulin-specific chaperone D n=1 Tax=Paramicrosporidium saccamoebae TaxID=1246581 RepID=A0A2H9TKA3_9FUNG|nr:Tubulin-specific chaperone D [Paramicrosporidium saccamoebae]